PGKASDLVKVPEPEIPSLESTEKTGPPPHQSAPSTTGVDAGPTDVPTETEMGQRRNKNAIGSSEISEAAAELEEKANDVAPPDITKSAPAQTANDDAPEKPPSVAAASPRPTIASDASSP